MKHIKKIISILLTIVLLTAAFPAHAVPPPRDPDVPVVIDIPEFEIGEDIDLTVSVPEITGTFQYRHWTTQYPLGGPILIWGLDIGGTTSAENIGEYEISFTPTAGYVWEDTGTKETRTREWRITPGTHGNSEEYQFFEEVVPGEQTVWACSWLTIGMGIPGATLISVEMEDGNKGLQYRLTEEELVIESNGPIEAGVTDAVVFTYGGNYEPFTVTYRVTVVEKEAVARKPLKGGVAIEDWKSGETPAIPMFETPEGTTKVTMTFNGIGTTVYGPTQEAPTEKGDYTLTVCCACDNVSYVATTRFSVLPQELKAVNDPQPKTGFRYTPNTVFQAFPYYVMGIDIGGTTEAREVGQYVMTATPQEGYAWRDTGTTETREYMWEVLPGQASSVVNEINVEYSDIAEESYAMCWLPPFGIPGSTLISTETEVGNQEIGFSTDFGFTIDVQCGTPVGTTEKIVLNYGGSYEPFTVTYIVSVVDTTGYIAEKEPEISENPIGEEEPEISEVPEESSDEETEPEIPDEPSREVESETPELPFTDVSEDAWYREAVKFVYQHGLMNGTSLITYEPETLMSRAMLVTVLYRLDGSPDGSKESEFADIPVDAYYTAAVNWAANHGIINGYDEKTFGPNDSITREQMTTILWRYAKYKGMDVTARANLSGYTDANRISAFAVDAMEWANAEAIIVGVSASELAPDGFATRAQVAQILYRYCRGTHECKTIS